MRSGRGVSRGAGGGARAGRWALALALMLFLGSTPLLAYVGPGAGFAFVSSFFVVFLAFILAFLVLLTWPIRFFIKAVLRLRRTAKSEVKRVIILGLDGQEPSLTERFMAEGKLPNFSKLKEMGSYVHLGTTTPAESPVAWSSFLTGCNPGKHKIYDFLVPNRQAMLPELSSADVQAPPRTLKVGRYLIPLGKAVVKAGRKSVPFWRLLGKHGVFSNVLRVPITFPPEPFKGVLLSAMCVPDLKGSQGTYFFFTSDPEEKPDLISGQQLPLSLNGHLAEGMIAGPENSLQVRGGEMQVPFQVVRPDEPDGTAELKLADRTWRLEQDRHTPWISVPFHPGLGMEVRGLCRFVLLDTHPHVRLYMTPLQIDPGKPALPISHPPTYAVYLAKFQGPFATLGVAEDTSALNEGILGETPFLEQCWDIHREREAMFFDALEKTPRGLVACVFDITDRLQHMFFRYLDEKHPALEGRDPLAFTQEIEDLYVKMDDLVGRTLDKVDDKTVLMVMSDHGFKVFRREMDLNAWLRDQGYLKTRPGFEEAGMLGAVDWEQTRAFAVGFGGIYLNVKGREARGIVPREEVAELKKTLMAELKATVDDNGGEHPVAEVYAREQVYQGPYVEDAPDLVVGFRLGYRAAWHAVTGGVGKEVFQDNTRPWSGDHNMNPPDVPGIFFCNRPVKKADPHIVDVSASVLDLFGVPVPGYMDGRSLFDGDDEPDKGNPEVST